MAAWWSTPITLSFRRWRQEDSDFQDNLGYDARPCLKTNQKQTEQRKKLTQQRSETHTSHHLSKSHSSVKAMVGFHFSLKPANLPCWPCLVPALGPSRLCYRTPVLLPSLWLDVWHFINTVTSLGTYITPCSLLGFYSWHLYEHVCHCTVKGQQGSPLWLGPKSENLGKYSIFRRCTALQPQFLSVCLSGLFLPILLSSFFSRMIQGLMTWILRGQ